MIVNGENSQIQTTTNGGMTLFRVLPQIERRSVGPFVFLDHYKHDSKRGIGDKPHPHAEKPFEGSHSLQLWAALPPGKSEMEPAYKSLNLSEFFDKKNSLLMFFYSFCIIRLNGPLTNNFIATQQFLIHLLIQIYFSSHYKKTPLDNHPKGEKYRNFFANVATTLFQFHICYA